MARAGRSVVALTLGGVVIGSVDAPALARARAGGDLDTLRLLAAGERLAVELYERAAASPGVGATLGIWIEGAVSNERDHQRALRAASPGMTIGAVHLARTTPPPTRAGVLAVAAAIEAALAGAYLGAVDTFASPDLRVMAAAIGANEAQHLAAVDRLSAGHLLDAPALAQALPGPVVRSALAAHAAGARLPS